ncbi:hypothetical protein GCM10011416_07990 [Polaribacter pacificus]|uniref:Uncharacterized protein n=1 Tax=Polaribacter pacificus TaxID=1775173 RepID=A0A917HVQ9_9FLAO|nr:hypothetical protein [Polaribacter pacificus]GGG93297.1 hypothetical protein GCM10011416_07990 [Polaribacter pacificus]
MKKNVIYLCFLLVAVACSTSKKAVNVQYNLSNNVVITGGDGYSFDKAKVVIAKNSREGIASEYEYLDKVYGKMHTDWVLVSQSLQYYKKKPFDVLKIKLIKNNKELRVHFNISSFFGKY